MVGTPIANLTSGSNLAFNPHKPAVSGTSAAAPIGPERNSGTGALSKITQRRVLAVTLGVLRSVVADQIRKDDQYRSFHNFLDRTVPRGNGVPEHDEWIPSIEVAYWYAAKRFSC
jgi:hypothetical protein